MSSETSNASRAEYPKGMNGSKIPVDDLIILTPYPVNPGHTLISITRLEANRYKPELKSNAAFVAEGDNAGIIINKSASIMDYNKAQASQKEHLMHPNAKMSFKVFMINSGTGKLSLEHRTLRFWFEQSAINDITTDRCESYQSNKYFNVKQEASRIAQSYFRQLIGSKPDDDFPKNYVAFIMKLMRLLKQEQFTRIARMEVELRQLEHDDSSKPPSRASSIDGGQSSDISVGGNSGRGSPLTSQKVLDIIESSYPNPISVKDICSTTQSEEQLVKQFLDELAQKEKISTTDDGQHFTRTTEPTSDTKIQLVKQMPRVVKAKQPVIAIITSQYCEKLAVDAMISDKETFVRYRLTTANSNDGSGDSTSANYVYTLGNIGDHRVVSTKLTSIGRSRGALIAAGNATTRLLGTFPEIEYVFLVGCGGGVVNYTDFSSHVRLGDVVISHLPTTDQESVITTGTREKVSTKSVSSNDYVYVHCKAKTQQKSNTSGGGPGSANLPVSFSIHNNLKKASANGDSSSIKDARWFEQQQQQVQQQAHDSTVPNSKQGNTEEAKTATKQLEYEDCHFRLWRPTSLDLQELTIRLWTQGLLTPKYRIWEYYIEQGVKLLKQQDIDASRPKPETDKLYMSIGQKDTIEVNHPEAAEDEMDLRREGQPMCHFGPIGSGLPTATNESLRQRMISEFGLRAFDCEFDPVVESIYGNCKESYIMIRGISDYKDGRKRKEWQQYSALVAAAFMKSIIINLKPL